MVGFKMVIGPSLVIVCRLRLFKCAEMSFSNVGMRLKEAQIKSHLANLGGRSKLGTEVSGCTCLIRHASVLFQRGANSYICGCTLYTL